MDKYNHWLGKLFGWIFNKGQDYAITLWGKTYFSCDESKVSPQWCRHETCHQAQQKADGTLLFLVIYIWQWVTRGFNHDKIDYEIEAARAEAK